ncbi:hypothetical protein BRC77_06285 [Halobacteriales archaeon QH_8_64_26]|nr:MAG: hypothetical protein BRC77_06285 [Halobacteriales archaeon QH_8_64_26]
MKPCRSRHTSAGRTVLGDRPNHPKAAVSETGFADRHTIAEPRGNSRNRDRIGRPEVYIWQGVNRRL